METITATQTATSVQPPALETKKHELVPKTQTDKHTGGEDTAQKQYYDVQDTPQNRKGIDSAIKGLELFQPNHPTSRFRYQIHQETGTIQVALINYMTGEVMEKIPSSKLLEYASQMEKMSGLVMEKKA